MRPSKSGKRLEMMLEGEENVAMILGYSHVEVVVFITHTCAINPHSKKSPPSLTPQ